MTVTAGRRTAIAGELRHVDKSYGSSHVLQDVSVQIGAGGIVSLIGRSGSGKSTVLRVLAESAPKFDDWVDRRYDDVLEPLLISTK